MFTYNLRRSVRLNRVPLGSLANTKSKQKLKPRAAPSETSENDPKLALNDLEKLSISPVPLICDNCKGHDQYTKVLQEAFKEVLDQNELLRKRVIELEALLTKFEDDIEEKDEQILKLQGKLKKIKTEETKE